MKLDHFRDWSAQSRLFWGLQSRTTLGAAGGERVISTFGKGAVQKQAGYRRVSMFVLLRVLSWRAAWLELANSLCLAFSCWNLCFGFADGIDMYGTESQNRLCFFRPWAKSAPSQPPQHYSPTNKATCSVFSSAIWRLGDQMWSITTPDFVEKPGIRTRHGKTMEKQSPSQ